MTVDTYSETAPFPVENQIELIDIFISKISTDGKPYLWTYAPPTLMVKVPVTGPTLPDRSHVRDFGTGGGGGRRGAGSAFKPPVQAVAIQT